MNGRLRAGVIGAGVFGGHHAAKYAGMEGVELCAVIDTHPDRTQALATRFGARAFDALPEFLEAVDVVSVASPAHAHARLALAALAAGAHVYVEKPLATTLEDADAIVAAAASSGLIAACGFQERAALEVIGLTRVPERPLRMEAARLNAPARRNLDVSVVLDLMIHDLDLALFLCGAEPLAVEAAGQGAVGLEAVEAEIDFETGFVASLQASRVAAAPARRLAIDYPSGRVVVDFLAGGLWNTTPFALDAGFAASEIWRDRLGASLTAFIAAVRGGAARPLADAADGVRALDLALAVEQAVGR